MDIKKIRISNLPPTTSTSNEDLFVVVDVEESLFSYDNSETQLSSTHIKEAITELDNKIEDLDASSWEEDNGNIKPKDGKKVNGVL